MSTPDTPPKPPTPADDDREERLDEILDNALEDTFPASDPPSVTRTGGHEEPDPKRADLRG